MVKVQGWEWDPGLGLWPTRVALSSAWLHSHVPAAWPALGSAACCCVVLGSSADFQVQVQLFLKL